MPRDLRCRFTKKPGTLGVILARGGMLAVVGGLACGSAWARKPATATTTERGGLEAGSETLAGAGQLPGVVDAAPLEPTRGGVIGLAMYDDPALSEPASVTWFDPRYAALWLKALNQPDDATRIQGAEMIAQAVDRGVDPASLNQMVDPLISLVEGQDHPRAVRQAAATTLLRLNAKRAGAALLQWTNDQPQAQNVLMVDRALVRWRDNAAAKVWRQRVTARNLSAVIRASAARSLGQIGEKAALDDLRQLALAGPDSAASATPANLRLAAAKAVGRIAHENQADAAGTLVDSTRAAEASPRSGGALVDRLVAVAMLAGSEDDPAAVAVIRQIAADPQASPAQARAIALLNHWGKSGPDPARRLDSPDARVRLQAVLALGREPTDAAILQLFGAMGDQALTVRSAARRQLAEIGRAGQPQAKAVRSALASTISANPGWRPAEQAALLVIALNDKAQAPALAQWLDADRPEVRLAADAAMLGLASKQTLPAIFARARTLTRALDGRSASGGSASGGAASGGSASGGSTSGGSRTMTIADQEHAGQEVAQLCMALGVMGYTPADEMLRRYIPKGSPFPEIARSAAIYALGKIHAGDGDRGLAGALMSRVRDLSELQPESALVQRFAAIAVGRIKSRGSVSDLRQVHGSRNYDTPVRLAAGWAVEKITGEAPPPLPPFRGAYSGFALEPIPPAAAPPASSAASRSSNPAS